MFILEILIIPFPENRVHVNDLSINIEYTTFIFYLLEAIRCCVGGEHPEPITLGLFSSLIYCSVR